MSLTIIYLPQFNQDVHEAVAWLNTRRPGLGASFATEVSQALNRLIDNPRAYRKVRGEVRQLIVHKFRYRMFFALRERELIVIGTVHGERDADRWLRARLGDE